MKKRIAPILLLCLVLGCAGCGAPAEAPAPTPAEAPAPAEEAESAPPARIEETGGTEMEQQLRLSVDGTELAVVWEDNGSVAALADLAAAGPLTVEMSAYGGFEQVGSLGTSLPRDDVRTTTEAGDIVLYAGDQLVIFYGSNTWAYTRLGRVTGLSGEELTALLSADGVTVTLSRGE